MVSDELFKSGTELKTFEFQSFLDWFVNFSSFNVHNDATPSYMLSSIAFMFGGIATLAHALIRGGRLPYLWLGIFLHGCVIETLTATVSELDVFWHGQTNLMFLGRRLPIHIVMLYPCFTYNASIAVGKMRLPFWAQPFAVGLIDTLIDLPYDIVSIRFLHWIWHDTDPNVYDRHYWVPWNSYYFHTCFAAGFTVWFHLSRWLICKREGRWIPDKRWKEVLCSVIAGLLGAPTGTLMFVPWYHPLKDLFLVHSEVIYLSLLSILVLIVWSGDRLPKIDDFTKNIPRIIHWSTYLLLAHLVFHYGVTLATVLFYDPEKEISTGFHEHIGNCNETEFVHTPFGMLIPRRKYFCLEDFDEQYFDFHCLNKLPSNDSIWYTTCGIPWNNSRFEKVEYTVIISIVCLFAFILFTNLHFLSYGDAVFDYKEKNVGQAKFEKKKVKKH